MVALTNIFFFADIVDSLNEKGWEICEKNKNIIIPVKDIEIGKFYSVRPKNVDEKEAFDFLKKIGIYDKVEHLLDFNIKQNYVIFCYCYSDKKFLIDDLINTYDNFKKTMIKTFPDISEIIKDFENLKNKSYSLQKICFN